MRLGVIADTHDATEVVARAIDVFRARGVTVVVHCGDITTPATARRFEEFEFHAVLGNNDEPHAEALADTIAGFGNGSAFHGLFADLEFAGRRFGVLHGVVERAVYEYAEEGSFDYVLHGHYHEQTEEQVSGTTVINPGAHRSVVILDPRAGRVEFVSLE